MTPVSSATAQSVGPIVVTGRRAPSPRSTGGEERGDLPRQTLLARSDDLLDELELLRLGGRLLTPRAQRRRIDKLRSDARLAERPAPRSLAAAHDLLLSMQQRWLNLNPRHPGVTPPPAPARGSDRWKHLPLPPCPPGGPDDPWRRLARATVERAFDRWCWAQHHATRAVREGGDGAPALERAAAAWTNYFQLRQEAARLGAWAG
jgi:hypothetical protein